MSVEVEHYHQKPNCMDACLNDVLLNCNCASLNSVIRKKSPHLKSINDRGCPRGVMVKAIDCGIVVREFDLQVVLLRSLSSKYPWEMFEPPYPPSYGLNSTTNLLGEWLWH